jgi:glutamine cyclotransferase
VTADGVPVTNLNELEWIKGEIYANVWLTNRIARINPTTGHVVGWIDLSGLLDINGLPDPGNDVLNGIAYDARHDRLFVTGKRWPKLFEITLVKRPSH